MKRDTLDKRKYSRVPTALSSISKEIPPDHPLIINVSHGGVCLWLSDLPPREQGLALQFRLPGHDHVLRSRIVWSRLCMETSDRENPPLAGRWLAGFAFAEGNGGILVADLSYDSLRTANITVSVLAENDAADNWQKGRERTPGVITFSEQSILGIKAAAKELLPVFAGHFTDVHMVFTRDRLEISAPFRQPVELNPPEARRRDYHTIQASQAVQPPAPVTIEQPVGLVQPKAARVMDGRRRIALIGVASLAAVILGWTLLGALHKSDGTPAAPKVPVQGRSIPAWAPGLDETSMDGWIELQKKFDLPDATVRSAIQILRTNDRYPPGQSLHDLAKYPAEAKRAFSMLAGAQTGTPFDFGPLENDLKGRMVEGVRFPDEAPGGRYSSLERESFNNVVVLAAIELFHRRQDDPRVKEILAALRRVH